MRRSAWFIEAALAAAVLMFAGLGFLILDESVPDYQPPPRRDDLLRLVTWNVGQRDVQCMNDQDLPTVAKTIDALEADLVLLQELRDRHQLDRLLDAIGDPWKGAVTTGADRRVAILFSRGTARLRETPAFAGRRGLIAVYRRPAFPPVAIATLHASALSSTARNAQIGDATDRMMRLPDGWPKIIAGDLNLDLDLDKRRDLFTDNEQRDVESYNYIAANFFDVGINRGATAEPDRRLDYIFVTHQLTAVAAGPWKGQRSGAMDHDPLVADLRLSDQTW